MFFAEFSQNNKAAISENSLARQNSSWYHGGMSERTSEKRERYPQSGGSEKDCIIQQGKLRCIEF